MISVRELIQFDAHNPQGAGTSPEEKLLVYSLVRQERPRTVLEIGVSRGHMTCWIALALAHNRDGGRLVSVDNWSRAHGGEANGPEHVLRRLSKTGLHQHVDVVTANSVTYLRGVHKDGVRFDFAWVDGDHSFDGAVLDIRGASKVTRGIVAVHDTQQQYSGPRDAVRFLVENGELPCGVDVRGDRGIWLTRLD